MPVQVFGYSERGMINSIIFQMQYSPNGLALLRDVLGLCTFPFEQHSPVFGNICDVTIVIEQSFSDFGDLDALFLLGDTSGQKHSLFLEAKVKTCQRNAWLITDEWNDFVTQIQHPAARIGSNLFVQIYRKLQLVRHALGQEPGPDAISNLWRIGRNDVVLRAARLLMPYAKDARFLSLVPDTPGNASRFFAEQVNRFTPAPGTLPAWAKEHLGYLTWSQLKDYCRTRPADWNHVLANFDYNRGQIYTNDNNLPPPPGPHPNNPPPPGPHPPVHAYRPNLGDICRLRDGRHIVIVGPGTNNHRWRLLKKGIVNPISESFLAATADLQPTGEAYHGQIQPQAGEHYLYEGREVIVERGGPERSRVRWQDQAGPSFLTYDHDLNDM